MDSNIIHDLDPVIYEVKKKTGIAIQGFKPAFLERRIRYRMRSLGILNYEEYVKMLSSNHDEAKSLYSTFSINVTRFFRDPYVWDRVEQDIIPNFLTKTRSSPIHAWSCGSASGEEPHSISILLNDSLKDSRIGYRVHATDISPNAIAHAKKGIYRNENIVNVTPKRREMYFEKTPEEQFKIDPKISNQIKYEQIDMMKTSGKLFDIIFCRNVLIYYDKKSHEIIFKKFADVLKKDGILVLGQDESMMGTNGDNFFELPYPKERIYQKKIL